MTHKLNREEQSFKIEFKRSLKRIRSVMIGLMTMKMIFSHLHFFKICLSKNQRQNRSSKFKVGRPLTKKWRIIRITIRNILRRELLLVKITSQRQHKKLLILLSMSSIIVDNKHLNLIMILKTLILTKMIIKTILCSKLKLKSADSCKLQTILL